MHYWPASISLAAMGQPGFSARGRCAKEGGMAASAGAYTGAGAIHAPIAFVLSVHAPTGEN
jgi:hypothetical protein